MNWHRHPPLLDRLAAEYALGTLAGGARRRFEAVMREQPAVARAALQWSERLAPLDAAQRPLAPPAALWARIERQAFGAAATPAPLPWWRRWLQPVTGAALASGVAFGLTLGVALPSLRLLGEPAYDTAIPESYVGVLATPDGKPGLIVASARRGLKVDVKRTSPLPLPAGTVPVLWTIDAQGTARAVAVLPEGAFVTLALPRPAEELFGSAQELAVSAEPAGALPAAPGSPFLVRGLCGKVWRTRPSS